MKYMMLGMWFGSIGKFMSLFKRQSSGLESCGWKIHLCVFEGSFVAWNHIFFYCFILVMRSLLVSDFLGFGFGVFLQC
jgi:hypothetical protein